jgi:hypothetical protein
LDEETKELDEYEYEFLTLRENPQRDRVRVLALLENLNEIKYSIQLSEKPSSRTSIRSLVRGSRFVSGHPHPRSMVRIWNEDEDVH